MPNIAAFGCAIGRLPSGADGCGLGELVHPLIPRVRLPNAPHRLRQKQGVNQSICWQARHPVTPLGARRKSTAFSASEASAQNTVEASPIWIR
jgi:hypothetical protein